MCSLRRRRSGRRPARSSRAALAPTLVRTSVRCEAARVQSQAAALWPSPCSLVAGCAGPAAWILGSGSPYGPLVAKSLRRGLDPRIGVAIRPFGRQVSETRPRSQDRGFAIRPFGRQVSETRPQS